MHIFVYSSENADASSHVTAPAIFNVQVPDFGFEVVDHADSEALQFVIEWRQLNRFLSCTILAVIICVCHARLLLLYQLVKTTILERGFTAKQPPQFVTECDDHTLAQHPSVELIEQR